MDCPLPFSKEEEIIYRRILIKGGKEICRREMYVYLFLMNTKREGRRPIKKKMEEGTRRGEKEMRGVPDWKYVPCLFEYYHDRSNQTGKSDSSRQVGLESKL